MPEKEEVETADPEAAAPTTIETPPAAEAVPPPAQEQADSKESVASGEPKVEDEAPVDEDEAFLARLAEVRESNPELAAKIDEKFTKPGDDVDGERLTWELEQSKNASTAVWNQVTQAAQQSQSLAEQEMTAVLDDLNKLTLDAATQLHDGKIEDPARIQVDSKSWASQHFLPIVAKAQNAAFAKGQADERWQVQTALESHDAHKYLTSEERGQFRAAIQTGRLDFAIKLQVDAALRSADKDFATKATAEAEKKAGVTEKMGKVFDGLGSNGKKPPGGASKESGPNTLEEVNAALINDETPVKELAGLKKQRQELLGN